MKRHLDIFDLETSLNEVSHFIVVPAVESVLNDIQIAEGSRLATDFASAYGVRAYQTQRSGATAESLPGIQECDEMITRQTRVLDSMTRIREVLVAQKIALAEQQNQERRYKATPSEFDDDSASYQDKMEGAGGFAGPDSKKRRGVCHFRVRLLFYAYSFVEGCSSRALPQLQQSRDARMATWS